MGAHELVASGSVSSGKLTIRNRDVFADALKAMRDGEVLVRIERAKATRSSQQNRYWWGVCVQLVSEHTGYTPDEIHDLAKQMFIPKRLAIANGNGEIVGDYVLGGTTTQLSTIEFGEFMESFRQWAAETLDVVIPDPEGF